jgi:hypothetical protein
MMAMHPPGKDGIFMPDRVVDNRMPDHLKKGYYDDVYWKDFFAGSREHLHEPKMGLRGDELRQRVEEHQGTRRSSARKTLADVLKKYRKSSADLGAIEIYNTRLDAKLPTHIKSHFLLH